MPKLLPVFLLLTVLTAGVQDTRLLDAVKSGNREAVRTLLKNRSLARSLADTPEPDGTTPLQWAVRADDLPMVEALLAAGASATAPNRYGVTPLELAATNGDAVMTGVLLKAGADALATKPGGQTILMTAARTGNPDVVRILLERGAKVNAKEESYGETALMWAASENHPAAAKLLIEHGADVNARSNALNYPKDRFGLEGVMTVLPHGSWTPLMYAARQGSLGVARVLAEMGAGLNLTDPDGTTALVLAIINSHYDTAALLLMKDADPNLADSAGMGALYAAVDMNTLGEVYGRPARPQASGDTTALDLIRLMLEHGVLKYRANPNAQLKSLALYRAHTPGDPTLGEGATPLMRAAKNGDAAAMRLLLENGADPSIAQKNHTTALMLAAGFGRGLGVFAGDYATEAQMVEGLKVLLDRHVDVNATNDNGQTALHFAALSSDATVTLLAGHGARLDIKDKQGRTPLDFALGGGGRGRAGGPPVVRETTAALLRQLMSGLESKQ